MRRPRRRRRRRRRRAGRGRRRPRGLRLPQPGGAARARAARRLPHGAPAARAAVRGRGARLRAAPRPQVHLQGQLDHAEHVRRDSEVALLFFYAPWCGQSITARAEIEQAATQLSDQVLFVAINCWWSQGKCRKQKHFFYFPVIYLYHRSFGPIEYKGPMSAVYIEKFVRRVMKPLLYIPSQSELLDFLSNYEPGVLGFFEFSGSPQPPGYSTFFTSALHSLKKDYLGTVRFGVITNKHLAKLVSLVHSGSVYLHRHFNSSLVFPREALNFTAENVCTWVLENHEPLLRWLQPHGGKSLLLHNELKKGPALFLFVPFNPLAENHPLIDEITQVALEYNNCHGDQAVERLLRHLRRVDAPLASLAPAPLLVTAPPCCNSVVLPRWHSLSQPHNVCELCVNRTTMVSQAHCSFVQMAAALDSFYLKEQAFSHGTSGSTECSNFLSSYSPFSYYTACCRAVSRAALEASAPAAAGLQGECEARTPGPVPHIEEPARYRFPEGVPDSTSFTGLSCRTNKTLNMYLLDSNLFWLYAERLGAPSTTGVREFATIVDVKEESHYILDPSQALVRFTLESFIQNFSILYSPLKRHLIGSDSAQFPSQHLITEVTTDTFWEVVLQKQDSAVRKHLTRLTSGHPTLWEPEGLTPNPTPQDVLLLYYAPWCGFCPSLNHVFIQLARLLPVDTLTVARIDVSQNDLPWEFMVDRLPTVLFFPCNRKDLSVKYPEDLAITLPNLLRFILHHSRVRAPRPRPTRLEGALHRLRARLGRLWDPARRGPGWGARGPLRGPGGRGRRLQALLGRRTRELAGLARRLQALLTQNAWLRALAATLEHRPQEAPMSSDNRTDT
ncbi:thioredoxin domain-containing protein 11 isoform X3 [Erinaceus europaeus]|uniref:Thioredoxin domain-containing protein 11 isoform X3 n=1 Tax=Erinaceus europaeus TaxID=9365 RepID=A0ABM3VVI4_ERIEU|nr:thioredoxin domain-containing protein 11 isoform X3 [Erinaceus europaeus]